MLDIAFFKHSLTAVHLSADLGASITRHFDTRSFYAFLVIRNITCPVQSKFVTKRAIGSAHTTTTTTTPTTTTTTVVLRDLQERILV
jgi:hypothetical protein